MYKITIKGKDAEPIFLEDGEDILKRWTENKLPARLLIKDMAINSSDIRTIQKIQKTEAENANNFDRNGEIEYVNFRRKMLSLSVDERGNIMRIPNMIWKAHGNGEMPQNVKDEIKLRQITYFTENPNCIFANPKIYRDLIPARRVEKQKDQLNTVTTYIHISMLHLIENIIKTDLVYSAK